MKQGIQTFLEEAGEAACYALCLIELSLRVTKFQDIDVTLTLVRGITKGRIHYSWTNPDDNDNFFVAQPAEFLGDLTGRRWTVTKELPTYQAKPGDLVVQRWERIKTGVTTAHFRLADWDSLADSQTVKFGALASLRVFREV